MDIRENIVNSVSTIWANKLRSGLTMLGIIIGIASVIVMVAIGEGAQNSVTERLRSMGTNLLIVMPGGSSDIRSVMRGGGSGSLEDSDIDVIKSIDGVKGVSPEVSTSKQVIYGSVNSRVTLNGVVPEFVELKEKEMLYGSFFSDADDLARKKVAVIDESVLEDVFDNQDPLGEEIRIENSIFTVVGVIEGDDGYMYIPLSTAQIRVIGSKTVSKVNVFVEQEDEMEAVQAEIETALLADHNISDPDDADFSVVNQSDMLETMEEVTAIFSILLGGIAGISLLVGGIGVMNIMLVSVTERTREIGIRKAVGAHRKDILLQFLTESVVLSLLGGFLGILLSFLVVFIIGKLGTSLTAVISSSSIILACSFAIGTGVVFGILPAYKASYLKPIDALRFE